jgi:cytidylate kinase
MASITVVSGGLGTGKTTLSKALAHAESAGLHLVADTFFHFPAHLLEPTTPESHTQNTTIMKAIGRAAAAFVEGGYDVFLDGVVGPWFLPTLLGEWDVVARVEYVILQATLEEALARVQRRDGPAASARVYAMHKAFAAVEGYAQHVIETTGRAAEEVHAECIERRRSGEFLLHTRMREGTSAP